VDVEASRDVLRPEDVHRIGGHRGRRRNLGEGPARPAAGTEARRRAVERPCSPPREPRGGDGDTRPCRHATGVAGRSCQEWKISDSVRGPTACAAWTIRP
jgi:hypothetical protein